MARTGHRERCISAIHWLETSGALALLGWVSLLAVIRTPAAQAQTYEVLFDLKGGADGSGPAGLIGDPEGDLYGTTYGGGIISLPCCPEGCGVVFRLDKTGETVLYQYLLLALVTWAVVYSLALGAEGEMRDRTQ